MQILCDLTLSRPFIYLTLKVILYGLAETVFLFKSQYYLTNQTLWKFSTSTKWHLFETPAIYFQLLTESSQVNMRLFFKFSIYQTRLIISPLPTLSQSSSCIFIIGNWHYYLFKVPGQETEYIFDSSLTSNMQLITPSSLFPLFADFIQIFIISHLKNCINSYLLPLP